MSKEQEQTHADVPEEFIRVVGDFVNDLNVTFPEYNKIILKWWKPREYFNSLDEFTTEKEKEDAYIKTLNKSSKLLYDFCRKKYPPRFFDILYQNDEIFKEGSDVDTEFLPKLHFRDLWNCDITDKTRETIWKYLQLITFSIVKTLEDKSAFGDSAQLFDAINETDFREKLEETMEKIQEMFQFDDMDAGEIDPSFSINQSGTDTSMNPGQWVPPDADEINSHLTNLIGGKIGKLASEIAEETARDLNAEFGNDNEALSMKSVFNKLIKNPTKLMGLIKNVSSKLDEKLKSGEIKESEMLEEATEILGKMKSMPGMGNLTSMLGKMGMNMGGLGGGGKLNTKAMEASLNRRMRMAQTKERMKAKMEAKNSVFQTANEMNNQPNTPLMTEEELIKLFQSSQSAPERTPRKKNQNNKKHT